MRSETSLNESEERFRAIFSQSAAGISQADLSGPIRLVNRRFCEIVGYSEAELLTMRMQDIIFIDDLPNYVRLFKAIAKNGESFEIELRYVRKDGSLVWVSKSVSTLDKDGYIRQAAAIVVDITERKRAQEGERRLAAIIGSSNDAIMGIDLNMKITSWNSGAEKLYGYSADEVMGRSVLIIVPDERIEEEPAIFRQVNVGLKVEPYETKRRRKDGELVDVLLSVSPIYDPYGKIVGAAKIAHDISARKDAERLQKLLVGELNHRVKNVLATVIAIARQTLARDGTDGSSVEAFEARLMSMARAHDLLTDGNWKGAELRAVVEQAVSPYPREKFESAGPAIHLPPKAALSISLALHELATNAAKYGALSTAAGRVSISWSLEANGQSPRLKLRWQETGGPEVGEPSHQGFGSRLIERLLAAELHGLAKLSYNLDGVVYELDAAIESDWDHQAVVVSQ